MVSPDSEALALTDIDTGKVNVEPLAGAVTATDGTRALVTVMPTIEDAVVLPARSRTFAERSCDPTSGASQLKV
jgi:hypothetical protein